MPFDDPGHFTPNTGIPHSEARSSRPGWTTEPGSEEACAMDGSEDAAWEGIDISVGVRQKNTTSGINTVCHRPELCEQFPRYPLPSQLELNPDPFAYARTSSAVLGDRSQSLAPDSNIMFRNDDWSHDPERSPYPPLPAAMDALQNTLNLCSSTEEHVSSSGPRDEAELQFQNPLTGTLSSSDGQKPKGTGSRNPQPPNVVAKNAFTCETPNWCARSCPKSVF